MVSAAAQSGGGEAPDVEKEILTENGGFLMKRGVNPIVRGANPTPGAANPMVRGANPVVGAANLMAGGGKVTVGYAAPTVGCGTVAIGFTAPTAGFGKGAAGFTAPTAGSGSATTGFGSRVIGLAARTAGVAPPLIGFVPSMTEGSSPAAEASPPAKNLSGSGDGWSAGGLPGCQLFPKTFMPMSRKYFPKVRAGGRSGIVFYWTFFGVAAWRGAGPSAAADGGGRVIPHSRRWSLGLLSTYE